MEHAETAGGVAQAECDHDSYTGHLADYDGTSDESISPGGDPEPVVSSFLSPHLGAVAWGGPELEQGVGLGDSTDVTGQFDGHSHSADKVTNQQPLSAEDNNAILLDVYTRATAAHGYNYTSRTAPVPSGLNIENWERYLQGYKDTELLAFLTFGWPINFDRSFPISPTYMNHASALRHTADIEYYLDTEMSHAAMLGPFDTPPFPDAHISPMMTRPKKDSTRRRVILDLSWPHGSALNDGISRAEYLGRPFSFHLPTVDFMAIRLRELGPNAYMYKTDLSRGYRQLRIDPSDWPFLGMSHKGKFYFDPCPPFGMRSSSLMMQRTTEAVSDFHREAGYVSAPYIDDFGGAEKEQQTAGEALAALQNILRDLGLQEASHKICPPSQVLVWLGIEFDSRDMTMKIPPQKLDEIVKLVQTWGDKTVTTRKELQSLLGSLNFVGSVSHPARIYTNRLLEFLRSMTSEGPHRLTQDARDDLRFFTQLIGRFNGVALIEKQDIPIAETLELDSCLTGCGGLSGTQYYKRPFPQSIIEAGHHISRLELLNIVVAVRVWAPRWRGRKIRIYCDNMAACVVLQTGRSRDPFMAACARAVFVEAAAGDIELLICHRPGTLMERADALSRAHLSKHFMECVERHGFLGNRREIDITDDVFEID